MKTTQHLIIIFLVILGTQRGHAQDNDAPPEDSLLVLKNVTIIDGLGNSPATNKTIIIKKDRIWKIIENNSEIPDQSKTIDLSEHFIIPGLIESHSHFLPAGKDFDRNNQYLLDKLKHALLGGITSIRDMGSDARFLATYKRAALLDQIWSPNLYYSALIAGPSFFKDPRAIYSSQGITPGLGPWMPQVTKDTPIVELIAAAKGSGATGIKLYQDMDAELIDQLIREAHKQGMKVWAHPYIGPARAMDLIDSGVDAISHAGHLLIEVRGFDKYRKEGFWEYSGKAPEIQDIFKAMKAKEVFLEPTIFVYDVIEKLKIPGYYNDSSTAVSMQIIQEAYDAGVQMIMGTDTVSNNPTDSYPHLHKELRLLAEGTTIPPLELIKSATYNGAKNLGIGADYGSIEQGKIADLVILKKDPSVDIRNTKSILMVIKNGVIYHREEE